MIKRERQIILFSCILCMLLGLVVSSGCGRKMTSVDSYGGMAEVRFHIDWRPMQFAKESIISPSTTDIVIRVAEASAGLATGYRKYIRYGDRWVTIWVRPGHGYDAELLCLRYSLTYVPIGYGIKKNLSFTADSTNYVDLNVESIQLSLAKPDTVYIGDDLTLRLTASNPYMADLARYLASTDGIHIDVQTAEPYLNSITLSLVSSGNFSTRWEWNRRFTQPGKFSFFIERAPADWDTQYYLTNFYNAYRRRIDPAWSPQDFGMRGSRFTVVIWDSTDVGY